MRDCLLATMPTMFLLVEWALIMLLIRNFGSLPNAGPTDLTNAAEVWPNPLTIPNFPIGAELLIYKFNSRLLQSKREGMLT